MKVIGSICPVPPAAERSSRAPALPRLINGNRQSPRAAPLPRFSSPTAAGLEAATLPPAFQLGVPSDAWRAVPAVLDLTSVAFEMRISADGQFGQSQSRLSPNGRLALGTPGFSCVRLPPGAVREDCKYRRARLRS
ncbi:hypothetical protein SKAU_G00309880 [Synaphobranchus kaupii]|uniref:Uncharacterized protein n=1 Tax=Synaphobranchus kaupii TaxID=118154 RepID=A0A9Q1IJ12_SYNKA|nr:hypothetical protein SKAU_G00309880 [Synaphobranchus kaupii]